jgi:hypothetical protein
MSFSRSRMPLLMMAALLATSACRGAGGLPPASEAGSAPSAFGANSAVVPADNTSILKRLTKDVVIGSTVDKDNGDKGPRALSITPYANGVLKKGQLLVCNFEDKGGNVGAGTTLEALDPKAGSKPTRFYQDSAIEGCDGDAIAPSDDVYAAGLKSGTVAEFSIPYSGTKYKVSKKYGSPIAAPLADSVEPVVKMYQGDFVFVGDGKTGSLDIFSANPPYGHTLLQGVTGFAVNPKASPGHRLGPSGIQYSDAGKIDTAYVVDGVTNTVVAVTKIGNVLVKDEIVVKAGGKTFDCKKKKYTCAHLVHAGKPLDAPLASALLPNGNLIVANTEGTANMLVELTPAGKILDTKVVDKSKNQGVFGLVAGGTSDSNTVLFYTDTNDNSVHELEH